MSDIRSLGYVGFTVSDIARWEELMVEVLGMQLSRKEPGVSLELRLDEMETRIFIDQGPEDDIAYVGWVFETPDALEAFVTMRRSDGLAIEHCDADLAARRHVTNLYCCTDVDGVRHEFAFGQKHAATPFASPALKGNFVTGELGMGHILLVAKDYEKSLAFISEKLGLIPSDYIKTSLQTPGGVIELRAGFFHTVTGRHHSLATAPIPMPKHLQHMMIEVDNMTDVGLAHDRCLAAGFDLAMGFGHHPNDDMFSFYVATPSGFMIEFGHGGIVIDDAKWEVKNYAQLSDWGHKPQH